MKVYKSRPSSGHHRTSPPLSHHPSTSSSTMTTWAFVRNCLLLMSLVSCLTQSMACPDQCSCTEANGETIATCRNMNLRNFPLSGFPENTIEIDFGNNSLEELTKSTFPFLANLCVLILDDCDVVSVDEATFSNMPALKNLKLSHNYIQTIDDTAFSGLNNLKELHLDHNKLTSLPPGLFRDLRLHKLSLQRNNMESIADNLFLGAEINNLILDQNNFTMLSMDSLKPLSTSLKHLHVSHNEKPLSLSDVTFSTFKFIELNLSYAGLTDFSFLKSVWSQSLDISGNPFTNYLDFRDFNNLQHTEQLYLRDLHLRSITDSMLQPLSNLLKLDVSHNQILNYFFSPSVFANTPNLQVLDLSHNSIFILDEQMGSYLKRLEDLHMDYNPLSALKSSSFTGMTSLRGLSVGHNNLPVFDQSLESLFDQLSYLNLEHNPLHCNCEMKWFRQWIQTQRLVTGADTCRTPTVGAILSFRPNEFRCSVPVIISVSRNQNVAEGEDVLLGCSGESDPAPVVRWDSPAGDTISSLPSTDRQRPTNHALWQLTSMRPDKSGWYKCTAFNVAGSVVRYTYVNVVSGTENPMDLMTLSYPVTTTSHNSSPAASLSSSTADKTSLPTDTSPQTTSSITPDTSAVTSEVSLETTQYPTVTRALVKTEAAPVTTEAAPLTTEPAPLSTEAAPLTTEPAPLTTESTSVTTEEMQVISTVHVTAATTTLTSDAASVTSELTPAITDAASFTSESTPVTTDAAPVTSESTPVTTDAASFTSESTPVTTDAAPVTSESTPVSTDAASFTSESTHVTTDAAPVTSESTHVTTDAASFTSESTHVTTDDAPVPSSRVSMYTTQTPTTVELLQTTSNDKLNPISSTTSVQTTLSDRPPLSPSGHATSRDETTSQTGHKSNVVTSPGDSAPSRTPDASTTGKQGDAGQIIGDDGVKLEVLIALIISAAMILLLAFILTIALCCRIKHGNHCSLGSAVGLSAKNNADFPRKSGFRDCSSV